MIFKDGLENVDGEHDGPPMQIELTTIKGTKTTLADVMKDKKLAIVVNVASK